MKKPDDYIHAVLWVLDSILWVSVEQTSRMLCAVPCAVVFASVLKFEVGYCVIASMALSP